MREEIRCLTPHDFPGADAGRDHRHIDRPQLGRHALVGASGRGAEGARRFDASSIPFDELDSYLDSPSYMIDRTPRPAPDHLSFRVNELRS